MEQIDILIGKKLAGEITAEEQVFLKNWRSASPENERHFTEMERLWQRVPAPLPRPLDIESALQKTKARIAASAQKPAEKPIFRLKTWWLAAAAALAVAVVAVLFFEKSNTPESANLIANDASGMRRDTLSDGSKIVVNGYSNVSARFFKNERRIELKGEAFFEVAHDAARPFTVFAKNLQITAVGTAFNVDEKADGRVVVRMAEGKVRLVSGSQTAFLSAGEEGVFEEKTGSIATQKMAPDSPADGWFSRNFQFDGTPLGEVLPALEKAYGVRILLKNNGLRNCKLRTRFSNEPIERVIEVLAETFSLKVERVGDGYVLDGAGCE